MKNFKFVSLLATGILVVSACGSPVEENASEVTAETLVSPSSTNLPVSSSVPEVSVPSSVPAADVDSDEFVAASEWPSEPLRSSLAGTQVFDVSTGVSTSVAASIDGDRPVLLWFWAPH